MAIGGDEPSLGRFENALRQCGVSNFSRASHKQATWVEVRGSVEAMFRDEGPLPCAVDWFQKYPVGLVIIGNDFSGR